MAKAKIISEQGKGRYVIQPIYDISRAKSRLNSLGNEISSINEIINALEIALSSLENQHKNAIDELNADIDDANANNQNNQEFTAAYAKILAAATKSITRINIKMVETSDLISLNRNNISAKLVEKRGIQDSFSKYENPLNQTAWCADYTEKLIGEVGVIAINDETNAPNNQSFVINAEGLESDTRVVQPAISSGSMAIAYNLCALPAFQKWKPRYRAGIISTINKTTDTCSVSFASQRQNSSIKSYTRDTYNIYQEQKIDNVPIDYMFCNASAFEIGDDVIVNFNGDITTPTVVGFLSNPKQCSVIYVRHAISLIYSYLNEDEPPIFLFDILTIAGAKKHIIAKYSGDPLQQLSNISNGIVYKHENIIYSHIKNEIYRFNVFVGNTQLYSDEGTVGTCSIAGHQDDDFIYISKIDDASGNIVVERFNLLSASSLIIMNLPTVGANYPLRVTKNTLGMPYYDNSGAFKFGIWNKSGTYIASIDYSLGIGVASVTSSNSDVFLITESDGSTYTFKVLDEHGRSVGLLTPDINDYIPGGNFSIYSLATASIKGSELWITTVTLESNTFFTVYKLNVGTDQAGVSYGLNSFLYKKYCDVINEFVYSDGWIHTQNI